MSLTWESYNKLRQLGSNYPIYISNDDDDNEDDDDDDIGDGGWWWGT